MDTLAYQVSLTLGNYAEDYRIDAIVKELTATYGPLTSIDDVPTEEYWKIVDKHDTKGNN